MPDERKEILETIERDGEITLPSGQRYVLVDGLLVPEQKPE